MTTHSDHDSNAADPNLQQAIPKRQCILVCQYRSCMRSGSDQVLKTFQAYISPNLMVSASGCLGLCGSGPNVRVIPDDIWYCRVQSDEVSIIFERHLQGGAPVKQLLHPRIHPRYDAFSYSAQLLEDEKAGSDNEV